MKAYAELCLRPKSIREAEAMADYAALMGIRYVGVEARERSLLKPFIDHGVEAFTRITIEASSAREAVEAVRKVRGLYDIVAVKPKGVEAARFAARDGRVDVVTLTPGMARYMDRSEARLIQLGGGVIEIPLNQVLERGARGLRAAAIIARRASAYDTPFTISTCATSVYEMWHPRSLQGLLVSLGVPENHALLAVSGYPISVLRRIMREI